MYEIEFYEKENGESDVWDFLEELREKSEKSKDARIQYNQLMLHIQLITIRFSNGAILVSPAIPDMAVKVMNVV